MPWRVRPLAPGVKHRRRAAQRRHMLATCGGQDQARHERHAVSTADYLSNVNIQDFVRLSLGSVKGCLRAAMMADNVVRLSTVSRSAAGGVARSVKPSGR